MFSGLAVIPLVNVLSGSIFYFERYGYRTLSIVTRREDSKVNLALPRTGKGRILFKQQPHILTDDGAGDSNPMG